VVADPVVGLLPAGGAADVEAEAAVVLQFSKTRKAQSRLPLRMGSSRNSPWP